MNPHPRIRKTVKWTALVLGVVLLAAGAVSTVWNCGCHWYVPTGTRDAGLSDGRFGYYTYTLPGGAIAPQYNPTWYFDRMPPAPIQWWPRRTTNRSFDAVYLPLWIPSLAAFGVGAALWRWDIIATRRVRAGLCPTCSYDRAGLALSAPCPECGKAA